MSDRLPTRMFSVDDPARGTTRRRYLDEALLDHLGNVEEAAGLAAATAWSILIERKEAIRIPDLAKSMVDHFTSRFDDEMAGDDPQEENLKRVDYLIEILQQARSRIAGEL